MPPTDDTPAPVPDWAADHYETAAALGLIVDDPDPTSEVNEARAVTMIGRLFDAIQAGREDDRAYLDSIHRDLLAKITEASGSDGMTRARLLEMLEGATIDLGTSATIHQA